MLAVGFARAGACVVVVSRYAAACDNQVAERSEHGKCISISADLASADGPALVAQRVRAEFGRLDVLVNNAGATWGAPLAEYPDAAFDRVLSLNVRAVFRTTVELLDELRAAARPDDPARVINISSVESTRVPEWENYAYPASKAAVNMLTRHLAKRLSPDHITVNALAPGPFPGRMIAFAMKDAEAWGRIEASVPLRRAGRPEDIVGPAIFLASSASRYITGAVLPVDGGLAGAS